MTAPPYWDERATQWQLGNLRDPARAGSSLSDSSLFRRRGILSQRLRRASPDRECGIRNDVRSSGELPHG